MNANTMFFIGIDVSKPFFDAVLLPVVEHKKQRWFVNVLITAMRE